MSTRFPLSSVEPLEALNTLILNNRGVLYKGNVFTILKYSLFIV